MNPITIQYDIPFPMKWCTPYMPGYLQAMKNADLFDPNPMFEISVSLILEVEVEYKDDHPKSECAFNIQWIDFVYDPSWMTDEISNYIIDYTNDHHEEICETLNRQCHPDDFKEYDDYK